MNRIGKERYPAAKLPDDLWEGIDPGETVTVTVVAETSRVRRSKRGLFGVARTRVTSVQDAVARIRHPGDEWN